MAKYKNLSGTSGVRSFNEAKDRIAVTFKDGSRYTYDESKLSTRKIAAMKARAARGSGLATIIATDDTIRYGFSSRNKGAK